MRGERGTFKFDHPFVKWAKEFEEYPEFHDEHDHINFPVIMDEFERHKVFKPKKGMNLQKWYKGLRTDDESVF